MIRFNQNNVSNYINFTNNLTVFTKLGYIFLNISNLFISLFSKKNAIKIKKMFDKIQNKKEISEKLKERAIFEGFTIAGIASIPGSSRINLRTQALERWLSNNHHAEMKWMEAEKRRNIGSLFEDAKSVLSVGFAYINSQSNTNSYLKVAKFGYFEEIVIAVL